MGHQVVQDKLLPPQLPSLSIVVPVLGDLQALQRLVALLRGWSTGYPWTLIVVEGVPASCHAVQDPNHQTEVAQWCQSQQYTYLSAPPSRGEQVASGIAQAASDWIWVLHADSEPSAAALVSLQQVIATQNPRWGRFDVEIPGLSLIAWAMNTRSRVTKICTGDQGMFFKRELLEAIGGFPQQPLMEDIEVSKRLKRQLPEQFVALSETIGTSDRRWRRRGVLRTVVEMWWYRICYAMGVSPQRLYKRYYGK